MNNTKNFRFMCTLRLSKRHYLSDPFSIKPSFPIPRFPLLFSHSGLVLHSPLPVLVTSMPDGFLAVPIVDIYVRSEGFDDPGKTPNTGGIAYIKVNGQEYSPRVRGHNVVIVDSSTGNFESAEHVIAFCV